MRRNLLNFTSHVICKKAIGFQLLRNGFHQRPFSLPQAFSSDAAPATTLQRTASSYTAPHNPAHIQPQTHSESQIPRNPREPPRCAVPACPVAQPLANVSACAAETIATNIAASSPY